jgi:hypothetical protein
LAGGGEIIHRDGLARQSFSVDFQKSRVADRGVLIERIWGVARAADIFSGGITACSGAEPIANAVIFISTA